MNMRLKTVAIVFVSSMLAIISALGQTKEVRRAQKQGASNTSAKPSHAAKTGVKMVDRKAETGKPLDDSYSNGQKEMRIPSPTWGGIVFKGQPKDKFKLRQISGVANNSDMNEWMKSNNLTNDHKSRSLSKGVWKGDNVGNKDVSRFPTTYQGRTLRYCDFYENCTVAYYANDSRKYREVDYIMLTDNRNRMYKLDFSAFSKAPYTKPGDEDFIIQQVSNAHIDGDILYIQHGHGTYAYSSGGKNAYISAIDLRYNKILWTTAPLTCNSNFIIVDNTIICGYGFSAEPDYLYLVDIATGQRRQTLKVATGPDKILKRGNQIHVLTYDHSYVYEISN